MASQTYQQKALDVCAQFAQAGFHVNGIEKRTTSNLFRYSQRASGGRRLDLRNFNQVIHLDKAAKTITVEGLTTFEDTVKACLQHNLITPISPELKHITIGGACVGIGIESAGFRHGFVHDSLIEAEVLTGQGELVTCNATTNSDLFHALPNSYGTLGYILKAKLKLVEAAPYVDVRSTVYRGLTSYLAALKEATESSTYDFVEGLIFNHDECVLITGTFRDQATATEDIYRNNIYYKLVRSNNQFTLTTFDYIFRYDPDWFWNVPETKAYDLFRRFAPRELRSSKFYNRYIALKHRIKSQLGIALHPEQQEKLIQDWQVPWQDAEAFISYALKEVDLEDRPWVALPIQCQGDATLFPLKKDQLYMNLGCYCYVSRPPEIPKYHFTRILDERCFQYGGLKMLYSSTFLAEERFNELYNGSAYWCLKERYDPDNVFPSLYSKATFPVSKSQPSAGKP